MVQVISFTVSVKDVEKSRQRSSDPQAWARVASTGWRLVVSSPLKNISQLGLVFPIYMEKY